jgi:hypothetical protein
MYSLKLATVSFISACSLFKFRASLSLLQNKLLVWLSESGFAGGFTFCDTLRASNYIKMHKFAAESEARLCGEVKTKAGVLL